ncbi:putative metalloprotease CJM1_0395 family protein [Pseudoduganella namucuonensis]|uniref:SprA-related family protein n=1 Tax=Pseudoduganella namucuonensis TaxID=1035707 RepID=A0A1I7LFK1_9BURK|nr:putative metalloprotease CJM1_0395 family protein [Pseudoduganella namucuonensis]SFV08470.1 SprA-related family protein [Pseudoduganella namucuonensis]
MSINAISPVASAAAPQRAGPVAAKAELTREQVAQLDKLKQRDTEVRQHELAHLSAAGGLATSGPSYTYQRGPNGVNYAVGGEVNIDTSPGATPEETIAKARTMQAAALAPAEPSSQDRAVAAQARQLEQRARAELERAYTTSPTRGEIDTYA